MDSRRVQVPRVHPVGFLDVVHQPVPQQLQHLHRIRRLAFPRLFLQSLYIGDELPVQLLMRPQLRIVRKRLVFPSGQLVSDSPR
jgi:hypothetical protein